MALLGRDRPPRRRDRRGLRLAFPRKNLQDCRIAGRKHQRHAAGLRRAGQPSLGAVLLQSVRKENRCLSHDVGCGEQANISILVFIPILSPSEVIPRLTPP